MSLEQKIEELTNKVELLGIAISTLTAAVIALVDAQKASPVGAAAEPAKRTRRTKEQIAADEAAAKASDPAKAETEVIVKPEEKKAPAAVEPPAVAAAPEVPPVPAAGEVKTLGEHLAEAQAKVPTKEELIAAFQKLVAKFGKEAATEKARVIINNLGAANVSGIPEAKRAEAVAAVDAELAKGA